MPVHAPPDLILQRCRQVYGHVPGFLRYRTPFELLIGVILSAQTTDEQVNNCTPALFHRYPDALRLSRADPEDLEELVHATGFYRVKARNIKAAAQHLLEHHGGQVPDSMEALVLIPGVGRKTAGVVLHHVFGKPAIIVDTHFGRVCRRLGFSRHDDPGDLESDLSRLFAPEEWGDCSMLLNLHGRRVCTARKPRCADCFLLDTCPAAIVGP
jgi:endonuclease-3